MGGLARRVSYWRAFKHRSNLEAPAIFVDAGNLFSDDRFMDNKLPAEVMTKNRWVVKGYNEFRYAAANINFNDLPYVAELMKKEGFDERIKQSPFIKRLISANVKPADEGLLAPAPYVIREVTLKRGAVGKKIRIGIIGVTEPRPDGANAIAGYRIEDPLVAAKRVIPELKQKADIIVALAYMPLINAEQLAMENPEINTIIAARNTDSMGEPQHFNNATITYATVETKWLGEMRYYVKSDTSLEKQKNRFVSLDESIPDDRAAQQIVTQASTEILNEKNGSRSAPVSFNRKSNPVRDASSKARSTRRLEKFSPRAG